MTILTEQGLKDTLKGLSEVRQALSTLEKHAEADVAYGERLLSAVKKVRGFVDIEAEQAREALRRLQDA